jgi:uncharacterized protein
VKFVLLYESADDVATKAPPHFPAHLERLKAFHGRGELEMVGTFEDPQHQGSMAIFKSREGVEEFVAGDPFVTNGVVRGYEIRGWNEMFSAG